MVHVASSVYDSCNIPKLPLSKHLARFISLDTIALLDFPCAILQTICTLTGHSTCCIRCVRLLQYSQIATVLQRIATPPCLQASLTPPPLHLPCKVLYLLVTLAVQVYPQCLRIPSLCSIPSESRRPDLPTKTSQLASQAPSTRPTLSRQGSFTATTTRFRRPQSLSYVYLPIKVTIHPGSSVSPPTTQDRAPHVLSVPVLILRISSHLACYLPDIWDLARHHNRAAVM